MNKNGVINIIEDDADDQFVLEEVSKQLRFLNKRIYFPDGYAALQYLSSPSEPTFLILSDINSPRLKNLELRSKLKKNAATALKCVPYLYFTTAGNHRHIIGAYCESAQGFSIKLSEYHEIKDLSELIIKYWMASTAVIIVA